MGKKHCGKRRNCSIPAISPFSKLYFQKTCTADSKNQGFLEGGYLTFILLPAKASSLDKPKYLLYGKGLISLLQMLLAWTSLLKVLIYFVMWQAL